MNDEMWHGWECDPLDFLDGMLRVEQLPENDLVRFTWPCDLWLVDPDVVWAGLEGTRGGIVMVAYRTS